MKNTDVPKFGSKKKLGPKGLGSEKALGPKRPISLGPKRLVAETSDIHHRTLLQSPYGLLAHYSH